MTIMKNNQIETCVFGEHVTFDGYMGDREKLNSQGVVKQCLTELPELLGMKPLCDVQIRWADSNKIKDPGGWSGYILIAESHISIHTFPARRFASADVYTCTNGLDVDYIVSYLNRSFLFSDFEVRHFNRGTKYPLNDIIDAHLPA